MQVNYSSQYYSKKDDLIIVSSDSEEYLEIAKGLMQFHFTFKNLSKDITKTEPVMDEVLNSYSIDNDDIVVLLQPTSPVRRKNSHRIF